MKAANTPLLLVLEIYVNALYQVWNLLLSSLTFKRSIGSLSANINVLLAWFISRLILEFDAMFFYFLYIPWSRNHPTSGSTFQDIARSQQNY